MEIILNVYSTSPKQAEIINARPTGEIIEEDDYIVAPGIDTSESIVVEHKIAIDNLREENQQLKRNLQENVEKLNETLKAVDFM